MVVAMATALAVAVAQSHCHTGALVHWRTGALEHKSTGASAHWRNGAVLQLEVAPPLLGLIKYPQAVRCVAGVGELLPNTHGEGQLTT